MKCLWCDSDLGLAKVIPNIFLMETVHRYAPDALVMMCLGCNREVLVNKKEPHGIVGTVEKLDGSSESIFICDDGELIVGGEIEL